MKQFTRNLLIIGFIILALLGIFYYLGGQKQASVLQVQVLVKGDLNNATIGDITAHLQSVNKISEPKSNLLVTPGITVVVLQDMQMIGEWTSVPYNGSGTYNLTVGLIKSPKPGETVRVTARVTNANSQDIEVVSKNIILT
jgi:multidrug efflux pump subunit AcrA (membrane-fusion protein)